MRLVVDVELRLLSDQSLLVVDFLPGLLLDNLHALPDQVVTFGHRLDLNVVELLLTAQLNECRTGHRAPGRQFEVKRRFRNQGQSFSFRFQIRFRPNWRCYFRFL